MAAPCDKFCLFISSSSGGYAMLCYAMLSKSDQILNDEEPKSFYDCFPTGSTLSVKVQLITAKKCVGDRQTDCRALNSLKPKTISRAHNTKYNAYNYICNNCNMYMQICLSKPLLFTS